MAGNKVDQILASIQQLRPMPTSVSRILRALEDPMTSRGTLAELIGLDQALAANVLQMANSAAMASPVNCSSIADAVMRLGFNRVKALVIGATVSGPISKRLNGYRLGAGELWNHSVATAVACQWLAQAIRYPVPEEAYVAGLLHDIGKLVLDQFLMVDYVRMLEITAREQTPMWQVENQLFGINHAQVGSLVATRWNFPGLLSDAIEYHHYPSLARSHNEIAAMVNLGNALTHAPQAKLVELIGSSVHPESMVILKLPPERVERLRRDLADYMSVGASV